MSKFSTFSSFDAPCEKLHTVSYLKALIIPFGSFTELGYGSTFTHHYTLLKSTHLGKWLVFVIISVYVCIALVSTTPEKMIRIADVMISVTDFLTKVDHVNDTICHRSPLYPPCEPTQHHDMKAKPLFI